MDGALLASVMSRSFVHYLDILVPGKFSQRAHRLQFCVQSGVVGIVDGAGTQAFAETKRDIVVLEYLANFGKMGEKKILRMKSGLRMEHTWQEVTYRKGAGTDFDYQSTDWVPSLSMLYSLGERRKLRLAYNMRLRRPGISYLNPYVLLNGSTMRYGNPEMTTTKYHRLTLDYNYSTPKLSMMQMRKEVYSEKEIGSKLCVLGTYSDYEEAYAVAGKVGDLRMQHYNYSDCAILYRTNAQSRVLEEAMRKRGIPYRIYGGLSFYQRKEVKDVLSYLRLIVNPNDEEAFKRIINFPARGIGDTTLSKLIEAATNHAWHPEANDLLSGQFLQYFF